MSFCRVFICSETVDLYLTQGKPLLWLTPVIVSLLASLIWVFMSLVDPWRSGMKAISSLCLTTSFHPDNKAKVTLCWQEAAWKRTIGPESQKMWQIYLSSFVGLLNLHNVIPPHSKTKEAHVLLSCFHSCFCFFPPQTKQQMMVLSGWKYGRGIWGRC